MSSKQANKERRKQIDSRNIRIRIRSRIELNRLCYSVRTISVRIHQHARFVLFVCFLQIHVSVVSLYPSQQLVVVANIDQDLGVPLDGLPQYAKGSGLEVDVVIIGFGFAVHIVLYCIVLYCIISELYALHYCDAVRILGGL